MSKTILDLVPFGKYKDMDTGRVTPKLGFRETLASQKTLLIKYPNKDIKDYVEGEAKIPVLLPAGLTVHDFCNAVITGYDNNASDCSDLIVGARWWHLDSADPDHRFIYLMTGMGQMEYLYDTITGIFVDKNLAYSDWADALGISGSSESLDNMTTIFDTVYSILKGTYEEDGE